MDKSVLQGEWQAIGRPGRGEGTAPEEARHHRPSLNTLLMGPTELRVCER